MDSGGPEGFLGSCAKGMARRWREAPHPLSMKEAGLQAQLRQGSISGAQCLEGGVQG